MRLDEPRILSRGSDLTLVSSGICTEEALRAGAALKHAGLSITHVHVSTLKPFDNPLYGYLLSGSRYGVITVENHTIIGGLGTVVTEKMASLGISKPIVKLGLQDTFSHGASKPYLMREHGIDALSIIDAVERLASVKLGVSVQDLSAVRLEPVHSDAKAEAL
jgi:transketolase